MFAVYTYTINAAASKYARVYYESIKTYTLLIIIQNLMSGCTRAVFDYNVLLIGHTCVVSGSLCTIITRNVHDAYMDILLLRVPYKSMYLYLTMYMRYDNIVISTRLMFVQ